MRKMKRLSLGKVKVVTFSNSKQIYGGEQGVTYLCSSYTTLVKTTLQNQSHNSNSTDDLSADTDCIV